MTHRFKRLPDSRWQNTLGGSAARSGAASLRLATLASATPPRNNQFTERILHPPVSATDTPVVTETCESLDTRPDLLRDAAPVPESRDEKQEAAFDGHWDGTDLNQEPLEIDWDEAKSEPPIRSPVATNDSDRPTEVSPRDSYVDTITKLQGEDGEMAVSDRRALMKGTLDRMTGDFVTHPFHLGEVARCLREADSPLYDEWATHQVSNGLTFHLLAKPTATCFVANVICLLRPHLISELKLTESHEIMMLDTALTCLEQYALQTNGLKHMQQAEHVPSEKIVNRQASMHNKIQASLKLFQDTIERLRNRKGMPRVVSVTGARNVAIQVNQGAGDVGSAHGRT